MSILTRFLKKSLKQTHGFFYSFIGLFLASVCAVLAISYPMFWFLAPVALAMFFVDIWKAYSLRSVLVRGFLFGLASGGAGIWWAWDTLPLDWMGLENALNGWYFMLASWALATIVLGLPVIPASWALWQIRIHPLRALIAAPIWVITEILRMWNFSILTYGGRSLLGPHFSATSLGYPLVENHYVLQLAAGGGVDFLNAVVALMGGVLALLILRQSWSSFSFKISVGVLALLLLVPSLTHTPARSGGPIDVVLVSTRIPVGTKETPDGHMYLSLLREASLNYPSASLFILPEEFRLQAIYKSKEQHAEDLAPIFGIRDVRIISSRHERVEKGFHTSLIYENGTGTTLASYRKMYLMPYGEYMPDFMASVFSLRPDSGLDRWKSTLATKTNKEGFTGVVSLPFKGHVLGGLICSDFLSPHLYRKLAVEHDADVLINSANPSWFHNSRLLYDKIIQISKVHAVQNRAYYLQSSNGAPAFAIDDSGRMIAETAWNAPGMLLVHVPGQGL